MASNLYEPVNGALLPQYANKKVAIIGHVDNVASNMNVFDMETLDKVNIKVQVQDSLERPLNGYIEVIGRCQSLGKLIVADSYIHFDNNKELSQIDEATAISTCTLMNSIPRLYEIGK